MSISQHPVHSPSSWPERCLAVVGSLMFAITFLAILTGVFSRYFNLHGFEWSFEIATIGFVWVTFIGTVIAEIRHENVRFHGLVKLLPAPLQKALDAFASVALLGISVWLLCSGSAFIARTGWMPTPVLRWPAGLGSLALISAATMLALLAVMRLTRLVRNGVRP
ncbi:TRAP transporter small permease [Pseudomonas syringae]|uniref:TRAP transporter small permease protein n=2 Tax=Pseudomonas syringae TaxID=317 RepID=A0A656JIK1_PSESF|nr:TRAP transporter small permease subunit [Pseudomonas syringae]EPN29833.1 TrapT dctQ-M fusion permease, dicarboxylate transport [Pseudomonas syringae pv. actinidiae ICMP 19096]EPM47067.1 TrapT dctQ-M fusion permease, dicarboxylate transport [Pseudomonas syringae pv. actinidiae ICMP 19098]EPN13962.1 TrapT dctQ-M fusion permease, dicarboxylate transport [Pseudomonas syringae pv. actinidiae ICMP 19100]EPN25835.1 TrapT dctQ-M fusion permease, dicarboxylate transport [Pseudomonas syringae pv. acti